MHLWSFQGPSIHMITTISMHCSAPDLVFSSPCRVERLERKWLQVIKLWAASTTTLFSIPHCMLVYSLVISPPPMNTYINSLPPNYPSANLSIPKSDYNWFNRTVSILACIDLQCTFFFFSSTWSWYLHIRVQVWSSG